MRGKEDPSENENEHGHGSEGALLRSRAGTRASWSHTVARMRHHPDRPRWRAALWLRRQRVLGRRRFIWHWLVPRLAIPAALLATLVRAATEPFAWQHLLLHVIVNVLGAGLVGGYIAGTLLWQLIVAGGGGSRERR